MTTHKRYKTVLVHTDKSLSLYLSYFLEELFQFLGGYFGRQLHDHDSPSVPVLGGHVRLRRPPSTSNTSPARRFLLLH